MSVFGVILSNKSLALKPFNMSLNTKITIGSQAYSHVGDLEWFEGALLSLFVEPKSGNLFFLHWVDLAEGNNRWLFFQVSPRALQLYLQGKLSNQDVFFLDLSPTTKLLELNGDGIVKAVTEIAKPALTIDYVPSKDGYFQPELCPDLKRISEILIGKYEYAMAA
jgi:hypothetical protein